jgi:hypothetical protein
MTPDPLAVQDVIDKELENITEEDIDLLIAYFRGERQAFAIAEASGKGARGAKNPLKAKAKSTKGTATQEDVNDILGGLL